MAWLDLACVVATTEAYQRLLLMALMGGGRRDPRGYSEVARHIVRHLSVADGGKDKRTCAQNTIALNKTVVAIRYGPWRCEVSTADGMVYIAKFCISTFSSGVVNAAVRSQSLFQPELPTWKADAFGKAQLGVYTKIFLHYEKSKFWADAVKSRRFLCAGSRQGSGSG